MKKVSIILPIYKVENCIRACIKSVATQTYKNIEAVLVDDGSGDNSLSIAQEILDNYGIEYKTVVQENQGLSKARNIGFVYSTGDYVVFVDSDDILTSKFVERLVNNLEMNNADISICNYQFVKTQDVFETKPEIIQRFTKADFQQQYLLRNKPFVVASILFKRELIEENNIEFDSRIRFSEDQTFMWDMINHSKCIVYTSEKMYGYYLRPGSIMASSSKDKILNSYVFIKDKMNDIVSEEKEFKNAKYILPRWELGALYTSSKLLNYNEFKEVLLIMDGKSIYKRLQDFNKFDAEGLSFLLKISPRIFYFVCRKII